MSTLLDLGSNLFRDDPVAGVLIVAIFMAAVAVLTKISIDNLKGRRDERP